MKKKTLQCVVFILFLTVLTLLAAYCLFAGSPVWNYGRGSTFRGSFTRYKMQDVAQIRISWKDMASTMKRKNGKWYLAERGDLPASAGKIHNLLSALSSVSPVKEVRNCTTKTLEELHLTDGKGKENSKNNIPGVRVVLKDAAGKELFNILLGKGHFLRPEAGMQRAPSPEGRYILHKGKVYLIPLVFEECHPVPAAWVENLQLKDLQKSLFMASWQLPEKATSLRMLFQAGRRSTAHPFTLLHPKGKQADNRALSKIAAELSKPFTGDYFTGDKKVLTGKESLLLFIRSADGFSYRLQVTDHDLKTDVLSLKVIFDPAKVLKIPGETLLQFNTRKKELSARFEEEKFYTENKLFLTGKKIRLLLKEPVFKLRQGPLRPQNNKVAKPGHGKSEKQPAGAR